MIALDGLIPAIVTPMTADGDVDELAHKNFTWIEERGTGDEVAAIQQQRFAEVVSDERPWDYIDAVYLPGTIDAIQAKVQARIDAGVEYLMLHTLAPDLDQLDLIARHLVEVFA